MVEVKISTTPKAKADRKPLVTASKKTNVPVKQGW